MKRDKLDPLLLTPEGRRLTGLQGYRYITLDRSDPRARAAKAWAAEAAERLGGECPTAIRWFAEVAPDETAEFANALPLGGRCRVDGSIELNGDFGPEQVREVVGHEVAHLNGASEAVALQFGERFAATEASRWTWDQWRAAVLYAKHQGASAREIAEALAR